MGGTQGPNPYGTFRYGRMRSSADFSRSQVKWAGSLPQDFCKEFLKFYFMSSFLLEV